MPRAPGSPTATPTEMREIQMRTCALVGSVAMAVALAPIQGSRADDSGQPYVLARTVLPIREPKLPALTELDARNAKAPPRFEVKAPDGAPNVVIVLIDDIGFGHSSAFGGPIHMPTLERMAAS